MFSKRIFRAFLSRRFGDEFENVFKTYLQQAEEIERKAKAKAKADAEASMLAKEQAKEVPKEVERVPLSPIEEFLQESTIVEKLERAENSEVLQIELENALL